MANSALISFAFDQQEIFRLFLHKAHMPGNLNLIGLQDILGALQPFLRAQPQPNQILHFW